MQFYLIRISFMLFDLEVLLIIPVGVGGVVMGALVPILIFVRLVSLVSYYEVMGGYLVF